LKTLFLTPEVHPPEFQLLLLEEVALEVEEEVVEKEVVLEEVVLVEKEVVKETLHPLGFFPK
jgi:hypothetical protein